jgi:nucleobase:cation symporter-1, NCS1 family
VIGETSPAVSVDVYEGTRPTHTLDLTIERQGMAPIPVEARYGSPLRNFTVWFAPDVGVSGVFTGSLAIILGLSSTQAIVAALLGTALGALPVAALAILGPRTGMGQLPLARLPFGKSTGLPAIVLWLTTIAWNALQGLFGGDALHLLLHVPFWLAVGLLLSAQGVIGFFGYEIIHQAEKWASVLAIVFFVIFTVKIAEHGQFVSASQLHGADAAGTFIFMIALSASLTFSWASCASEYSRYLPAGTSRTTLFASTFAGLFLGYGWVLVLGALIGTALSADTASGVRDLMGGGVLGAFALLCMAVGAAAGNAMNDYSGSLALQAGGVRLRRPYVAALVSVMSFLVVLWLHAGNFADKFENVILFASYWVAPFVAVITVDWWLRRPGPDYPQLRRLLALRDLPAGWPAALALTVGFAAMIPFMNASLVEGPVAKALDGADLSLPVGFLVAAAVYATLRRFGGGLMKPVSDEQVAGARRL